MSRAAPLQSQQQHDGKRGKESESSNVQLDQQTGISQLSTLRLGAFRYLDQQQDRASNSADGEVDEEA